MRAIFKVIAIVIATVFAVLPTNAQAQDNTKWLDMEVGKSVVLETPGNATAIAITDDKVARIVPLASASRIQIQGLSVGGTDLVVQISGRSAPIIYEITVHQDLSDLIRRIDAIVEGEPPRVYPLNDRIVVQGPVDDLQTLESVAMVASIFDEDFVNLMTVRGDHQVQVEVVFAEVSRSGLRELGINFWWNFSNSFQLTSIGPNSNTLYSINDAAGNVLVPSPAAGGFNLMGVINPIDLAAFISILDDYQLSKTLAQPTMVALSGQKAEFLSGGEIPVPGPGGNGQIQIEFKEFGIIMWAIPTVLAGDVIDLQVYVEVSRPDYSIGTRLTGIEIPGFVSRKTQSHVRIDSGMTFAMAGLLVEETTFSRAQVPFLGEIPVIGALFRYVRHERTENELVIYVTPRLVRPLGPGEVPAPPGTTEDNNPGDLEFFLLGMDHRPGSRTAKPSGQVGLDR